MFHCEKKTVHSGPNRSSGLLTIAVTVNTPTVTRGP